MLRPLSIAILVAAAGAACGSDSSQPNEPTIDSSVFEIQSRITPTGTRVRVEARIIAISSTGDRVWIADALVAGGFTGVEVVRGNGAPALGANVGDEVEVVGKVQEFGTGSGLTVTQIADSPDFTVLTPASGAPVPLDGLNPSVITQDPVPGAAQNGEPYEGVLIRLNNLEITGTTPYTFTSGAVSFGAEEQVVDLTAPIGTCYASVTGIWNYNVVTDQWVIVPVPGGLVPTGCDPV